MNGSINDAEAQGEMTTATARPGAIARSEAHSETNALKGLPEQLRLDELEAANTRLLQLVGELLVVNQQLREKNGACQGAQDVKK
jgi:hypothetical protein